MCQEIVVITVQKFELESCDQNNSSDPLDVVIKTEKSTVSQVLSKKRGRPKWYHNWEHLRCNGLLIISKA